MDNLDNVSNVIAELEKMREDHTGIDYESDSDSAWERNPYCSCGKRAPDCEIRRLLVILDAVE